VKGRISKAGDADVRRALYEAASALLTRFKRKDKTWGLLIARRTGHRKATVAAARELAGDHACVGNAATSAADVAAHTMRKDRRLLAVLA
jgi:transposase